ncbi:MAG: hypothetical protein EAY75_05515 [Bacteroidetes bacterium]|nr:MAG: hypothetical protein EAY75_05515 [Bacteroidota bacterium]
MLKLIPTPALHTPVPTVGKLPFNVVVVAQMVWFVPALATVGKASRVIATVLSLFAQVPLLDVHLNI